MEKRSVRIFDKYIYLKKLARDAGQENYANLFFNHKIWANSEIN